MAIPITCPECRRTGNVPDLALGKTIRCPSCSHQFVVMAPNFSLPPEPIVVPSAAVPVPVAEPRPIEVIPVPAPMPIPTPVVTVEPTTKPIAVEEPAFDFDYTPTAPTPAKPTKPAKKVAPVVESDNPFGYGAFADAPEEPSPPTPAKPTKPAKKVAPVVESDNPFGYGAFADAPEEPSPAMDLLEFGEPVVETVLTLSAVSAPVASAPTAAPIVESLDFFDSEPEPEPEPIAARPQAKSRPAPKPEPTPEAEMEFDEPEPEPEPDSGDPFAVKGGAYGKKTEAKVPSGRSNPRGQRNPKGESPPKKWLLPVALGTCAVLVVIIIGLVVALMGGKDKPSTVPQTTKTQTTKAKTPANSQLRKDANKDR